MNAWHFLSRMRAAKLITGILVLRALVWWAGYREFDPLSAGLDSLTSWVDSTFSSHQNTIKHTSQLSRQDDCGPSSELAPTGSSVLVYSTRSEDSLDPFIGPVIGTDDQFTDKSAWLRGTTYSAFGVPSSTAVPPESLWLYMVNLEANAVGRVQALTGSDANPDYLSSNTLSSPPLDFSGQPMEFCHPRGLAVRPDNGHLLVGFGSGALAEFNVESDTPVWVRTLLDTAGRPENPSADYPDPPPVWDSGKMRMGPQGKTLWILSPSTGFIHVLDVLTGAPVVSYTYPNTPYRLGGVQVSAHPQGFAFGGLDGGGGAPGSLYVSDNNCGCIRKIQLPALGMLTNEDDSESLPSHGDWTENTVPTVVEFEGSPRTVYNVTFDKVDWFSPPENSPTALLTTPTGLEFGLDGNLYVSASVTEYTIGLDDKTGRGIRQLSALGDINVANPRDLVKDPVFGNLFMSSQTLGRDTAMRSLIEAGLPLFLIFWMCYGSPRERWGVAPLKWASRINVMAGITTVASVALVYASPICSRCIASVTAFAFIYSLLSIVISEQDNPRWALSLIPLGAIPGYATLNFLQVAIDQAGTCSSTGAYHRCLYWYSYDWVYTAGSAVAIALLVGVFLIMVMGFKLHEERSLHVSRYGLPPRARTFGPHGLMLDDDRSVDVIAASLLIPPRIRSQPLVARYDWFRAMLNAHFRRPGYFRIYAIRDSVLEDSIHRLMDAPSSHLRRDLKIEFVREVGQDLGGLSREYMQLLTRSILDPSFGLFTPSPGGDRSSFVVNPDSALCQSEEDHLLYFRMVGRVLGMALINNHNIDFFVTPPLYKMLLGRPLTLDDLKSVDPEIYRSMVWVRDNDLDSSGVELDFKVPRSPSAFTQEELDELRSPSAVSSTSSQPSSQGDLTPSAATGVVPAQDQDNAAQPPSPRPLKQDDPSLPRIPDCLNDVRRYPIIATIGPPPPPTRSSPTPESDEIAESPTVTATESLPDDPVLHAPVPVKATLGLPTGEKPKRTFVKLPEAPRRFASTTPGMGPQTAKGGVKNPETAKTEPPSPTPTPRITNGNKGDFLQASLESLLVNGVRNQVSAIATGLFEVVPRRLLDVFAPEELEMLVVGTPEIDVADWKQHTVYVGYASDDPHVEAFWAMVEEMSDEERAGLLAFTTGTSRVPFEGFRALRGNGAIQWFTLKRVGDRSRLPVAHTCFNCIDLPPYTDPAEVKDKIRYSIAHSAGFDIN